MKTTVYPSRPGGFPPASFLDDAGAARYARQLAIDHPPSRTKEKWGICSCPAESYEMHYAETVLWSKAE